MKWRFTHRLSWSNWTFGVWWGGKPMFRWKTIGVDLGPLELTWRKV